MATDKKLYTCLLHLPYRREVWIFRAELGLVLFVPEDAINRAAVEYDHKFGVREWRADGSERIQLGRTARVIGNIQTPRLILEDGAILEGSCSMLKAKEAADSRTSQSDNSYQRNEYVSTSTVDDDEDETESLYSTSTTETEDEEEKADAAAVV